MINMIRTMMMMIIMIVRIIVIISVNNDLCKLVNEKSNLTK
jgi:hypothetical protein